MPYANNRSYNTRNSGRFNTPGQFVSAGEPPPRAAGPAALFSDRSQPQQQPPLPQEQRPTAQLFGSVQQQQQASNLVSLKQEVTPLDGADVDMAPTDDQGSEQRPAWMKSRLQGVKKISNKERRRRQNENLRRLLTPKNALMVLNEMMPGEQFANQFKVEPAAPQYYGPAAGAGGSFCADLTVDGSSYKGYGENKLTARNAAAEQAVRDLIIRRMARVLGADASSTGSQNGEAEEEPLPMIQLASFALHKLFSEWEYEGHKVPQLKPAGAPADVPDAPAGPAAAAAAAVDVVAGTAAGPGTPRAARRSRVKAPKELPADARRMHPCMLLTFMRPQLAYRELCVAGDKPQRMLYTVGVDVDNATYIGKASNKKEARKAAATAACQALFGVSFVEPPAPAPAAAAAPAPAPAPAGAPLAV